MHSQAQLVGFCCLPAEHCTGKHWHAQVCGLATWFPWHAGHSQPQVSGLRTRGDWQLPAVQRHWQVAGSKVNPGGKPAHALVPGSWFEQRHAQVVGSWIWFAPHWTGGQVQLQLLRLATLGSAHERPVHSQAHVDELKVNPGGKPAHGSTPGTWFAQRQPQVWGSCTWLGVHWAGGQAQLQLRGSATLGSGHERPLHSQAHVVGFWV